MAAWVLGPAARGARKIFGRPVGANGEIDATGVDHLTLLRLAGENIIQANVVDGDLPALIDRVAELEVELTTTRQSLEATKIELAGARQQLHERGGQIDAFQAAARGRQKQNKGMSR